MAFHQRNATARERAFGRVETISRSLAALDPEALDPDLKMGESTHSRHPSVTSELKHDVAKRPRTWRGSRSSERYSLRQLRFLEYALLALVVLSVAITFAMAIFNPSG